jgi:hypothetical protein
MPVLKYRSVEDMPSERWLEPGDPAIVSNLRLVCRMGVALAGPLQIPRGVHRYRSGDELYADKDRWETVRVQSIRAAREGK